MHPQRTMFLHCLPLLLASTAAAQSAATVLNIFLGDETLTSIGAGPTATTYVNDCPSDRGTPTIVISRSDTASPSPSPTSNARRQLADYGGGANDDDDNFCYPYTLIQGASTWEFHLTDETPGAWTADSNCNWEGELTAADITCTATQSGSLFSDFGASSTVFKASEIADAIRTVAVVSGTGSPTAGKSSGLAPPGPLPTGAMVFVGGAAGLLAAALAL